MARLKILLFLLTVMAAGATMAGAWWYYTRVISHAVVVQKEIKLMQGNKALRPDPGISRYERAVAAIKDEGVDAARNGLYDMLRYFPDSSKAADAKRILGEMNMDQLFSYEKNPARKEYTVQPGDSLARIARNNQTTVECLMRANGMVSGGLQPSDKLTVFPLDFEIKISVHAKTLTLLHNGRFFKEYQIAELRLPAGVKAVPPPLTQLKPDGTRVDIPKAEAVAEPAKQAAKGSHKHHPTGTKAPLPPGEFVISSKTAWASGKQVVAPDSKFNDADKWLMADRTGFNIRSLPEAKAVESPDMITTNTITAPSKGSKTTPPKKPKTPKSTKGKKGVVATGSDDETEDSAAPVPESGVFLSHADTEELFCIIRPGTKLHLFK